MEKLRVKCTRCEFICNSVPLPVKFLNLAMKSGNMNEYNAAKELFNGDIFIVVCQKNRHFRSIRLNT